MDYIFNYFNNDNHVKLKQSIIKNKNNETKDIKKDITKIIENNVDKFKNKVDNLIKLDNIIKKPTETKNKNENKDENENLRKDIIYYNTKDNFDLQILHDPNRKNKKLRTKRPIDKRLPNIDNSLNIILCSKSTKYNNIIIVNLLDNSQFYKGYFNNIYLIGKTIKKIKTLKNLANNSHVFNCIDNNKVNLIMKEINTKNNGCVVLNNINKLNINECSKLYNFCSNYRNILSSKNGGGMIMLTNNNYSDFTNMIKKNVNTYIIGKLNKEDYNIISEDLGIFFKDKEYVLSLFDLIKDSSDFLIFMIEGNNIIQQSCIYKNWEELIYPLK